MNITFRTNKLERIANNPAKCHKELGTTCAKRFQIRLEALRLAVTLEDVRNLPGHFHELTENRKGQWACDLEQPYRLIFEPHEDPVPEDANGICIWCEIKGIEIIEITDYHK
ncbi:MAG: killer suppression protein HigA [Bacteroidetes bacterium GWF2_40_14]|nr:MAG: killer suppression protein HigA [Bacteroidetes bacterium GWF2_40_14]